MLLFGHPSQSKKLQEFGLENLAKKNEAKNIFTKRDDENFIKT